MINCCTGCCYFHPIENAYVGVLNRCELGRKEAECSPSGCGCELYTDLEDCNDNGEHNGERIRE